MTAHSYIILGDVSCVILNTDISLKIESSTLRGSGNARFLYMEKGATLNMLEVTATNFGTQNETKPLGGAVICAPAGENNIHLSSVTMKENYAELGGCLLLNPGSWDPYARNELVINDSTFELNSAVGSGGVLLMSDSNARISGTVFKRNTAGKGGTFSFGCGSVVNIDGCVFIGNSAERGGVLSHGGDLGITTIQNSTFKDNIADDEGNVIRCSAYNQDDITINISNDTEVSAEDIYNWQEHCKINLD